MIQQPQDFEYYYLAQITEMAESVVKARANAEISILHPALKSVEDGVRKSSEYASMIYKYLMIAYKSGLPKNLQIEIKNFVEMLNKIANEEKDLEVTFTHPESMRRAFKMWERLEIIGRHIFAHAKLSGLADLTKMKTPHIIATYIAVESFAKSNQQKVPQAERIFPEIKPDLDGYRTSVFREVEEIIKVTILPTELKMAKNLIEEKSMDLQSVELKSQSKYSLPISQDRIAQNKTKEFA
jgi:coproporphyrinogen III oxidase-like Fe-S oxidoreductase